MIKDIYVIHDSHTDIGYTHTQGRILQWYSDFARQAIELAEKNPEFRWTCETFVQVEQFWQRADADWRRRFLHLVRTDRIGLSANWANFNELPDEQVFAALATRARRFADEHRLTLNCAVLGDINGCPLSYARVLARAGVSVLLTHVNPWHGCVLRRKRMQSFWWDLGDDHKLLVYYGEHYHFGNELGLFPGAETNATNFREPLAVFDDDVLERRLKAYLEGMEQTGWGHDFLVVTGSGLLTDNSPPGDSVIGRIARWNADPAHATRMQMITASDLPGILMARTLELPTFTGDWPDWWADGSTADPEGTMLYRQAQRDRRWLTAAGAAFPAGAVEAHRVDTALGFYSEHTFGHSSSLTSPWNPLVQQLHLRKVAYAAEAADMADALVQRAAEIYGAGAPAYNRALHFVVVNPHDTDLFQVVEIEIEACEAHLHRLGGTFEIIDSNTHAALPHQALNSLRGRKILTQISVPARSTRELFIRKSPVDLVEPFETSGTFGNRACLAPSGSSGGITVASEHGYFEWNSSGVLTAWQDPASGRAISLTPQNAFVLEMNLTTAAKDAAAQFTRRAALGQNRQGADSKSFAAKPTGLRRLRSGLLVEAVQIDYEMPGFEFLKAEWTIYRGLPMADIEITCHKIGTWDLENVYCPLPFNMEKGALWIDRGLAMRPWQDQLPGTMTDFYGTQEGLAWCSDGFGVGVAMLDSHLIHCGDLRYRERRLMGDQDLPSHPDHIYAWLMTNYWETNFSAELGGFYSFRFHVGWGPHLADPKAALRWARLTTSGLKVFSRAK